MVKGPASTRRQIFVYALLVSIAGFLPVLTGLGGYIYAATSVAGGLLFLWLSLRVLLSRAGDETGTAKADLYEVKKGDKAARNLFAFSILYLFILFAALLVEHGAGLYSPTPFAFFTGLVS
ncbi:Heme O synthase, protoheme IX farnesyltransferase COX10-CtaB [hydrothermal vent metagenome]|uniref:Heme O synthase, protoheme IX farnesyltransferase COX10-CtaB n=1 Tax=hydrothermal vent metagenome TaxID=652676 RepID=A0A3B0S184_9ZZZZ